MQTCTFRNEIETFFANFQEDFRHIIKNITKFFYFCSFLASLVAVFGEFDISGELEQKRSVTRNVRRVIVNRGYDPGTFENDLALLELDIPITFDDHIVPICMPEPGVDYTGRMATVTGWGRLKYSKFS